MSNKYNFSPKKKTKKEKKKKKKKKKTKNHEYINTVMTNNVLYSFVINLNESIEMYHRIVLNRSN